MQKIPNIYNYYHSLSKSTKSHFQLLSLSNLYLTTEPIILTQFLSSINQNTPIPAIDTEQFLASLKIAKQHGWISQEKEAHIIKINPIFSSLLKKERQHNPIKGLPKAFLDFYSAYCNYLINEYFNAGDEALQIEGVKVALYEYSNFEKLCVLLLLDKKNFAYQLFKKAVEQVAQADIAQILGIYHTELQETTLAIPYFKEAFVIYQSLGDLDGMAAVKENRETFLELTGEWFELSPHKYLE